MPEFPSLLTPTGEHPATEAAEALQFRRRGAALAAMGALYFAAVGVPLWATHHTGSNVGVWPAAGFGLVAVLLTPRRWRWMMAAWIAAVNWLAIATLSPNPLWMQAALVGIHVLEEWGGAELLERALGRSPRLDRSRDLILNVVIVGTGMALVGAVLGAFVYGPGPGEGPGLRLLQWWAPEAVALTLVAPAVWHARRAVVRRRDASVARPAAPRRLEALAHVVLFSTLITLVLALPFRIGTLPVGFVAVPFLLWAAVRLGTGVTAADTVILACVLVAGTYFGRGPFGAAAGTPFARVLWAFGYVLIIGVAHQILAATIHERQRGERALARAHAALRASSARMEAFFQSSTELVLLVDDELRLLAATPAARELVTASGRTMPAVGEPVTKLDAGPSRTPTDEAWLTVLNGRRVHRTWTVDGVEYEVTFTPLHDASRRIVGAAVLATDVSRVREQAVRAARSQRLETVGRLAGGVAHDFNNILTAILGHVSLIEGDLPSYHPLKADMREVIANVRRASDLTRQLLAYARQQVVAPTVVDVNDVLDRLRTLLRHSIGEDVALDLRLAGALPPVRIDRGQLEQVIVNLCVNARDAMPGGGRLTIETGREVLEPRRAASLEVAAGACVVLTVSDTGQGIAPDVLPKIFEPFFSTKGPGVGTGLGLATVEGIVRQAGGAIAVASTPGVGTTFRILLPVADGMPVAPEAPAPPLEEPIGAAGTVVVCEDDVAVRAVVVRSLERHGLRVMEFDRGADVLAALAPAATEIDLLVTDVIMPEMSGPELAGALRARWPELRVLYLSGYAEAALARQGVLDEGVDLLGKPFTPDELVRRVREALGQRA